jgi:hypothetical protein
MILAVVPLVLGPLLSPQFFFGRLGNHPLYIVIGSTDEACNLDRMICHRQYASAGHALNLENCFLFACLASARGESAFYLF